MNRKFSKKLLALLTAAVLLVSCFAFVASAEESTAAVSEAAKSVCAVVWGVPNTDNPDYLDVWFAGSGFFINEKTVVTANHIFFPDNDDIAALKARYGKSWRSKMVTRVYYSGTNFVKATYSETARDAGADIATLNLSEKLNNKPLKLVKDVGNNISSPAKVWALGFDYNENTPNAVFDRMAFSAESVKFQDGIVNAKRSEANYNYLETSCRVKHGYSGGPVVNENGDVVGITCWQGSEGGDNAVYVDYIIKQLELFNVAYEVAGEIAEPPVSESDTSGDTSTSETTTEPPATVATADLSAAITSAKTKSEKDYDEDSWKTFSAALSSAESALSAAESQDAVDKALQDLKDATAGLKEKSKISMPLIIGVAAAVIVIIIIIIIIVVASGKKKGESAEAAPVAPPAYPPYDTDQFGSGAGPAPVPHYEPVAPDTDMQTGVLNTGSADTSVLSSGSADTTVLSAQPYATLVRKSTGESISVAAPTFVIGKERRSVQYCIDNNKTISRRHAQIVKNGANVAVVDLGSTNGTFVNGVRCETKAAKNLATGDKLTLSDEDFEVTIL